VRLQSLAMNYRENLLAPLALCVALSACGGANQTPAAGADAADEPADTTETAASEPGAEAEQEEAAEETAGVPTKCASSGEVCTPPRKFVERLCQNSYPGVALVMFHKDTPWTRGYLTRETKAWNASGGASDTGKLAFDEEVVILRKRGSDMGGMQVSGAGGGFDALRWNGSCVTLAAEEVTLNRPPSPKTADVTFRWLDDPIQEALRKDERIDAAYKERRKECKGANSGEVSLKCVKADSKLSESIVQFVREGGALAEPEKLP